MKIQNEYIELTNDADSKYKLSVKKGNNIKHKIEHFYLMHREYIIGAVVGFIIGAIIF